MSLAQLTNVEVKDGAYDIYREGNSRYVAVTFNVRGRDLGTTVEEATSKIAKQVKLPRGASTGGPSGSTRCGDSIERSRLLRSYGQDRQLCDGDNHPVNQYHRWKAEGHVAGPRTFRRGVENMTAVPFGLWFSWTPSGLMAKTNPVRMQGFG